jgi:anti-sigma B factor antagonist
MAVGWYRPGWSRPQFSRTRAGWTPATIHERLAAGLLTWRYNRASAPMTLTERRIGDVTLLELKGRLVFADGDSLLRAHINELVDGGRLKIILDLKDITYIDSCGVGVLIAKFVSVRRKGGDVRLLTLSPRSHHVMKISGLLTVFETFTSENDAVASFSDERPH